MQMTQRNSGEQWQSHWVDYAVGLDARIEDRVLSERELVALRNIYEERITHAGLVADYAGALIESARSLVEKGAGNCKLRVVMPEPVWFALNWCKTGALAQVEAETGMDIIGRSSHEEIDLIWVRRVPTGPPATMSVIAPASLKEPAQKVAYEMFRRQGKTIEEALEVSREIGAARQSGQTGRQM